MAVATFEGIVEDGNIRLPDGVRRPERAKVFVVVPGGVSEDEGEIIELPPLPRRARLSTPRLARPKQADTLKAEEYTQRTGITV